ncbi:MAG: ribosome silencing factor [Sedimentisphaerales bacterium]|nr:ribosome silencing factor [Sedimentisphaerales bacterium]
MLTLTRKHATLKIRNFVTQDNPIESPSSKPDEPAELTASRAFACEMARLARDRHCEDILILELAGRSPVANHFVICTGTSNQQIRSVGHEMEKTGKENGFSVFGRAGTQQGRWVVVDFVDVVVHLFDEEYRKFYDLELLWGDAPKIDWEQDSAKSD